MMNLFFYVIKELLLLLALTLRFRSLFFFPVYSIFAFFEYFFVYCNIGFHATAIYDFQDVNLEVSLNRIIQPVTTKKKNEK